MTAYTGCGILIVLPLSAHPECAIKPNHCSKSQLQTRTEPCASPRAAKEAAVIALLLRARPERPRARAGASHAHQERCSHPGTSPLRKWSLHAQADTRVLSVRQQEPASVHRMNLSSKAGKSFGNAGRKKFHWGKRRSWQRKTTQECKGNMETNGV